MAGLGAMTYRALLLSLAGVVLAILAWRDAAIAHWAATVPASAPAFLRANALIALKRSDEALLTEARDDTPTIARDIALNARTVIRETPLNAAAMRQLGLASYLANDPDFEDRLRLAQRVSRREQGTQLALLALAVGQRDDEDALRHLDRLMTVNPRIGTNAFPVLVALLPHPAFRHKFAAYARRPWFRAFLATAAREVENPDDVVSLALESHVRFDSDEGAPASIVLTRLLDARQYRQARRLAAASGGIATSVLDDFSLTAATSDPGFAPLTWRLAADAAVQARLAGDGALNVEARPGALATVIERVTHLQPGSYVLDETVGDAASAPAPALRWKLRCARADARPIWQQSVPLGRTLAPHRAAIRLPQGCTEQHWQLQVLTPDRQAPVHFQITALALERRKEGPEQ